MVIARVFAAAVALLAAGAAAAHEGVKGPKGGVLFEGDGHKYHAELVVDAKAKAATVYVLDGKAKKAVPVKAKTAELKLPGLDKPLTLAGVPRKGADTFTEFRAEHDGLGGAFDFHKVEIRIQVKDGGPAVTFTPE